MANDGLTPGKGSLYRKAKLDVQFALANDIRQVSAALARGGRGKKGADLAILSLPTFVAIYEQLQALRPRVFFVLGRSHGREGLAARQNASLLKLSSKGQIRLAGPPGAPATLLALFVLDQAGLSPERVKLVEPQAAMGARLVAFQRTSASLSPVRSRLLLSTADATGLVPYVVIAPAAYLKAHRRVLASWVRVTLDGAARLSRDVPAAARTIHRQPDAPSVVNLLSLLGWIQFASLADNVLLAGVSGRSAVTLDGLFRLTWRLWRASGLLSTPGPRRAPLHPAVVMAVVRDNPERARVRSKGGGLPVRASGSQDPVPTVLPSQGVHPQPVHRRPGFVGRNFSTLPDRDRLQPVPGVRPEDPADRHRSLRSLGREDRPGEAPPPTVAPTRGRTLKHTATGIHAVRLNASFYVQAIDRALLPAGPIAVGDKIVACDGKRTQVILDREILQYEAVTALDAARHRYTAKLFFRWDKRPGEQTLCLFRRGSRSFSVWLTWKSVASEYPSRFKTSRPLYKVYRRPYGHRIRLTSFLGIDSGSVAALERFVKEAPRFRNDRVLVIDVRGNGGGSGTYGLRWIKGLYGYTPPSTNKRSRYWASPGNLRALRRTLLGLLGKKTVAALSAPIRDVLACFERGKGTFVTCPLEKAVAGQSSRSTPRKGPSLFSGKLYVLTDSWCLSSTETFVDRLRSMPNVIHAGVATDASTRYGANVRFESPPSRLFFFSFTTGISADVHHASGKPLIPHLPLRYDPARDLHGGDSLLEQLEKRIETRDPEKQ